MIAESYSLEIKAWQKLIEFYQFQLHTLKHKLFQAVKAPVLIRDSARLETYQVYIIQLQDFLYQIEQDIQLQNEKIDTTYLFDDLQKNESIEHHQVLLRHKMYTAEKKYLSFRYALSQYLISIFEVVILNKLNGHLPNLRSIGRGSTNIAI